MLYVVIVSFVRVDCYWFCAAIYNTRWVIYNKGWRVLNIDDYGDELLILKTKIDELLVLITNAKGVDLQYTIRLFMTSVKSALIYCIPI